MEKTGAILSFFAGLLHLTAFLIYNWQILKGQSRPNIATWGLQSVIAVLNCASYIAMSGDWIKGLMPIVASAATLGTFILAIKTGMASRPQKYDFVALAVGAFAIVIWQVYKNATYANILLQACFLIAFVPTYRGVLKNKENEKALPWFMWASAYILLTMAVIFRWQEQFEDLLYPLLGVITHIGISAIVFPKKTKSSAI